MPKFNTVYFAPIIYYLKFLIKNFENLTFRQNCVVKIAKIIKYTSLHKIDA